MSKQLHPTRRLLLGDEVLARRLFSLMAEVFETTTEPLDDAYISSLLARSDFWTLAAFSGDDIVGGLTAHTLPMTRGSVF